VAEESTRQSEPAVEVDLSVDIAGVEMRNPLMPASGTCGYATECADFLDLDGLGAFVTKSITLRPTVGNEYPRVVETRAGMLNAIGLANVGLEAFLAEKVPLLESLHLPVFVNVAGARVEEYAAVAEALEAVDVVRGIELNVSCPNVKKGGILFGVVPEQLERITAAIRKVCRKNLLIVKLSPNVTDITVLARQAVEAGADALSLVNTFTAMAVDIETQRPVLGNVTGGLSGPAIQPIALHMVHRVHREVARPAGVPLIGMGGIQDARDAIAFLLAGATGLAVGTVLLADPPSLPGIRDGIAAYLRRHGYRSVRAIIGALETNSP